MDLALGVGVDLSGEALSGKSQQRSRLLTTVQEDTYVVVIGIDDLARVREGLVSSTPVGNVVSVGDGVGDLVQSGSTTNVARSHGGARAETGVGNLVEEDAAVVDVGGGDDGVGNDTTAAGSVRVGAAQTGLWRGFCRVSGDLDVDIRSNSRAGGRVLVSDTVEDRSDTGGSVRAPVSPVQGGAGATAADV